MSFFDDLRGSVEKFIEEDILKECGETKEFLDEFLKKYDYDFDGDLEDLVSEFEVNIRDFADEIVSSIEDFKDDVKNELDNE